MAGILTGLCVLHSLPVNRPPSIEIQNGTYQLYPVNKKKMHEIRSVQRLANPDNSQILVPDDDSSISNSYINFDRPTIMFFHGFLESSTADDARQIKDHYLNRGDYNVIVANNQRLLAGPYYVTAALNTKPIGKYAAYFVDYLVGKGLRLSYLHIIGMSLGGQIAGYIGKNMKSGKASRITGLDPAGPLFTLRPQNDRLSQGDAEFVDVIHSNAGVFGIKYQSGDVDIWLNGGTLQPGCTPLETLTRNPGSLNELVFCNHFQSYRTYVMSLIDPHAYLTTKCSSYAEYESGRCHLNDKAYLGVEVDRNARGNYYVDTGVTAVNI
ncbi:hypothetical protein NQ317_009791 [Molorchus minor]|uniref:Lipase domain-containing protein n=1 Tax=Molorchus minor TaxID=1323400 RepID=A0ABQ9JDV5_9CUCU|nr:hypothetical protein NQ317_009791 [Molorchus minor]